MLTQEIFQRPAGAIITHTAAEFADDEPANPGTATFGIVIVHAVVTNLRVGHCHDLAVVGRIGEDFLVSGHAGVENDLAIDFTRSAEGASREHRAVFKREFRHCHLRVSGP